MIELPDIVYVYKHSDSYRNKKYSELEYSIKSLKNILHSKVYIVGDNPNIEGVEVIKPMSNYWSGYSKYHDQINKYLTIAETKVTENFIAFNDDMFVMRPWEYETYHREPLEEHIEWRRRTDIYQRGLLCTLKYLKSFNHTTKNFELHTPIMFNKYLLADLIKSLPIAKTQPFQIRSLYGNIYKVKSSRHDDVKNIQDFRESTLLSTNESTFNTEIGEYIREELSK